MEMGVFTLRQIYNKINDTYEKGQKSGKYLLPDNWSALKAAGIEEIPKSTKSMNDYLVKLSSSPSAEAILPKK